MLNTLKTTLGFLGAVLQKYTPLTFHGDSLEEVYNYLQIDERIATSGQPTEAQFRLMPEAGYLRVINLAPQSVLENSLTTEPELLAELGIEYTHIPVDFQAPGEQEFARFVEVMAAVGDDKVWVHCAANMRVSAFMYRYRRDVLQQPEGKIGEALARIWEPSAVWKKFLD